MQRRLDVALGLINRPQVLFLDEPTAGLDPESRTAMWDEIGRLAADDGLTILLTTHYLEEADRLASRVAIVDRGRIVAEGTPDELKGQLHGDAVHIELADRTERGRLRGRPGAGARRPRDPESTATTSAPAPTTARPPCPPSSPRSTSRASPVRAATVARPSLDDVYLRYAGRRFADARPAAGTASAGGAR